MTAPAWDDKQIARFKYRHGLFMRRGLDDARAEALADRMATRDYERDDRRMCIECESLQRSGGCFVASKGRMRNTNSRHTPVIDILQRCDYFTWQKP